MEYWLISQYRPIGRANATKRELYGYERTKFDQAVEAVRLSHPDLAIFAQPTREQGDPYPLRVWVALDGNATADLGSVDAPRNDHLGNVLEGSLAEMVRRVRSNRERDFAAPDAHHLLGAL